MDGLGIISNLNDLLEKGYDPNELADRLDSAQLYECFETLMKHGLKATDEVGAKIRDWQYHFISEGFVYPKFKTNYYVLDSDGFGYIHDETSLPLIEFGGYREQEDYLVYEGGHDFYFALITIASHVDSILKCGFSKEAIAEWFLDNGEFDDDELFPYELVEDTVQFSNFLKIMSCGEKYAKAVIRFFYSSYEEPGKIISGNDERDYAKFNMFVAAIESFIDAGIEKEFLIDCISEVCYRSLAYYLYDSDYDTFSYSYPDSCADTVWNLLDIPIEKVMTEDMFYDSEEDANVVLGMLSDIIDHYGIDEVKKSPYFDEDWVFDKVEDLKYSYLNGAWYDWYLSVFGK